MASPLVFQATDANFKSDILGTSGTVLVDFWAEWCGPCKALGPTIDELATEFAGKVKIAKMNVDENPETPGNYRIRGIPTLLVFKNGEMVEQLVGAHPKQTIADMLKRHA